MVPEVESKVLEYTLLYPTHGQVRVENELKEKGLQVSAGGVRGIWIRHGLTTKALRLKWLEGSVAQTGAVLTESQVQAFESAKEEKQANGEIETFHPGFHLGQDTYYVGYIKGVGKIYQQTGINTYSNVAFANLYLDKTALAAADFLNDRVLPFFDREGIRVLRTLTDRGTEYNGDEKTHPYQLFCHLADIEHTRTKARSPQTNGCTERMNQIIQDEFHAVAFRKRLYASIGKIQADLDTWREEYNERRTNQGKRCQGRTPMQTFREGLDLYQRYVFEGVTLPTVNTAGEIDAEMVSA